ncbi:MAG TPA: phosphohistidine phosphatase SixA [Bacteroidota bacterium]|nr:phosphohistidine phosphatase SixA [Bacteroidota bacterium]
MILYFIRHGEAGTAAPSDFERTLTNKGEHDLQHAGRALKSMMKRAHHLFASPYVRAQQSASILNGYFENLKIESCDHLTPGADPRNLFAELQHCTNDSNVLLVSHEPFISSCISTLTFGSAEGRIAIRPASVACVSVGPILERGSGRLEWLMSADQLARLT